jgi:hypothetical protein
MQNLVASKYSGIRGVPLSIVASGDNPETGKNEVVLEDPEGVTFSVPREWITGHDIENAHDEFLDHTNISGAPAGELERIWQAATNSQAPGGGYGDVPTVLSLWKGGIGKGEPAGSAPDADEDAAYAEFQAKVASGKIPGYLYKTNSESQSDKLKTLPAWHPSVAKSQLERRNPTNEIPAEAGTGWGNPGQVWNPRTQLWENPRRR